MSAIATTYLILIIHGQALWGVPKPFPSIETCEASGAIWDSGSPPDNGTRGHLCLPGPIAKSSNLQGWR